MREILLLSMYRKGKKVRKSSTVENPKTFFMNLARSEPIPFKNSMEVSKVKVSVFYILISKRANFDKIKKTSKNNLQVYFKKEILYLIFYTRFKFLLIDLPLFPRINFFELVSCNKWKIGFQFFRS